MSERIVRVPLQKVNADDEEFVLLRVQSNGARPLDLQLTGTDNRSIFSTSVKHSQIAKLQASRSDGDPHQWEAVLSWLLLQKLPETNYINLVDTLDVIASVQIDKEINVTIRHSISGITQRLGSISLSYAPQTDADLFQWAGLQAASSVAMVKEQRASQSRSEAQEAHVQKLQAQLEEFTKRKREETDLMLEQFRQLLNTKKLKIRDQQRLLSGAKVDPHTAEQVKRMRDGSTRSTGTKSRKRRVSPKVEEGSDDNAFADHKEDDDTDTDGVPTPMRSDESDEDEAAFEAGLPTRASQLGNGVQTGTANNTAAAEPPPPRQLPFSRSQQAARVQDKDGSDEDEDEDTDDEL